jgi:acyl-CoA synthetase (AMP-forming)/AMP-acid ligase II
MPASSLPASAADIAPNVPQIRLYQDWLREQRGLAFDSYDALWRWSVTDLDAFWQSIWDYARIESPTPHTAVLAERRMPGARWFPGAQVNYAREVLRHVDAAHAAGMPAMVSDNERGEVREMSWPEMRRQVASVALTLKSLGVQRGDRVAAYMPNVPETMVAFLACSSIGAVWSVCAPDMGTAAVADRFRQIEPKVLIAVDGVHYGGKPLDRSAVLQELRGQLPSVKKLLLVKSPYATQAVPHDIEWTHATDRYDDKVAAFEPEWLPFDHPIWIVYSSGTTGLPKPIVHGQGGIILTMHACGLHNDVGPSYGANNFGERYHWYSSTGWVMWNSQLSGMAFGATICIYDGNPAGSKDKPDWGVLWRFVARHKVTFFGAGAAYFTNCMKAGLVAKDCGDLSRVRALGSTGSPLPEEVQRWGSGRSSRRARRRCGGATFRAAPTSAAPSSAATASCPKCPGRCNAVNSATRWRPGTRTASPSSPRWASWCAPSPFRRCRCTCGATRATRGISRATSTPTPAYGATATGSRSASTAAASSTGAATPPSTARACAWAPARSTARSRACRRCSTRWWSTWSTWAATATCRCSWCCAPAWRWTTRCAPG